MTSGPVRQHYKLATEGGTKAPAAPSSSHSSKPAFKAGGRVGTTKGGFPAPAGFKCTKK